MPAKRRSGGDPHVRKIRNVLQRKYASEHPRARIDVKRFNSVSVRVRVIDPDFRGKTMAERDRQLWQALHELPEETHSEITMLLPFTPEEADTSVMNLDFENPAPSRF